MTNENELEDATPSRQNYLWSFFRTITSRIRSQKS